MASGAVNGYILTTDASGNARWQINSAMPSGTNGQTIYFSGTTPVATSDLLRLTTGDYSINSVRVGR